MQGHHSAILAPCSVGIKYCIPVVRAIINGKSEVFGWIGNLLQVSGWMRSASIRDRTLDFREEFCEQVNIRSLIARTFVFGHTAHRLTDPEPCVLLDVLRRNDFFSGVRSSFEKCERPDSPVVSGSRCTR